MFQFPGFALKPLCIQGKSTWLTPLMSTSQRGEAASGIEPARSVTLLRSNNNRISGGFPHSDIHGSKPVPGSPWLNAGYHVLHRLLLPRHPPNALFALDLIQKEQGWFNLPSPAPPSLGGRTAQSVAKANRHVKSMYTYPLSQSLKITTVSVLDLETISFLTRRSDVPSHGNTKRY
jgi:hypothetical protein